MAETVIPHSRPLIEADDIEAVKSVLESGMIAGGEQVSRFEGELASYIGLKHAAAVSSGTAALFTILSALGVRNGDTVITSSYVCSALIHAIRMCGAEPVPADSGDDLFHCDADTVSRVLRPSTKAILFPHMFGAACDIGNIIALGIPVIEDCALSVGSMLNGRKSGSLGSVASVFSFYATKVIAAGEGGMVVSDDAALVDKIRDYCHYDNKIDDKPHFNFAMTDIAAALGRSQLSKLERMIERRRMLARLYSQAFASTGLLLPVEKEGERHIFFRYAVQTENLDCLRESLHSRGVNAERPVFRPLSRYPGITSDCPRTEEAWRSTLSLPLYPAMSDSEAGRVISAVLESV